MSLLFSSFFGARGVVDAIIRVHTLEFIFDGVEKKIHLPLACLRTDKEILKFIQTKME
jgi:hypothetical protein